MILIRHLLAITLLVSLGSANAYLPVVLWHGMGDTCCFPFSMGRISSMIEDAHDGTFMYSVMVGDNIIEDEINGYFKNVNDQVDEICAKLQAVPELANGYHAVGFSQGGQFLRALAQKCPTPKMSNLITLGGQHQGVFGVPPCEPQNTVCEYLRRTLHYAAYNRYVQDRLVQAEYWHDPLNETLYKESCVFLPDINQENTINEDYRTNLLALENLVLVLFTEDTMVIPRESSWFGYYTPGQDVDIQTLQDSPLYTEDRLGLKQMDTEGRLHFLATQGNHLEFTDEWFMANIVDPYLT